MPYSIQVGWSDVPHLTKEAQEELAKSYLPHELDARSKGIPILGAGRIYPVPDDIWLCDPFEMPPFWPRAYGMDVGWNKTAAIWGAWDRDSDTVYCYSEYYQGQAEPAIHADAIRARGHWIQGAIDPAAGAANQLDGRRLRDVYGGLGLILFNAENTVEAGIHAVYQRLAAGRLRIFRTLGATQSELRLYRRDDNGKVVKENDHLMDALRYLIMTGLVYATTAPHREEEYNRAAHERTRSKVTGY